MSLPTDSSNRPSEYVDVTQILDRYVATHTSGKDKTFIGSELVKDISVAQSAAELFSKDHNIIYIPKVDEEKRRIFTVLKHENKWYPAELQKDKTILLTSHKSDGFGQQSLGGTKNEAIHAANLIAFSKKGICFPGIGIAIAEK